MICNLNQLSFQSYGTIESERLNTKDLLERVNSSGVVELNYDEHRIMRCSKEIWLRNHANMTVLSVFSGP